MAALSYKRDKPSGNSQVQPIKFKIQALPNKTIKKEDKYSLKITVQLQGDKQHTETKSITLTAKQDGKDCQVPIRKVDSTKDANPTATILDSSSMILSEDTPPISLAQLTAIPDHIAVAYSHSTNTEPSTPTGSHFTVKLKNKTLKGGVRNFVLVSIQPDKQGMSLRDFFVNTSMSAPGGAAMGSNRKNKQGRLVYDQPLTDCCVSGLLLDKANCLGANDTSFSRGQEIAFRIEVKPDSAIDPGAPYTLTVTVECPGNHPHTTTQSITLTAPPPSTRTTKKEH